MGSSQDFRRSIVLGTDNVNINMENTQSMDAKKRLLVLAQYGKSKKHTTTLGDEAGEFDI